MLLKLKFILIVTAFNFFCLVAWAQSPENLDRILLQLSGPERAALREGKISLVGDSGSYRGRFLVKTSVNQAWEVLSDYDNFEQFLPNVIDSKVLEVNGNQQIFEQSNSGSFLFFTKTITVKIAVTENEPQTIDFNLIEGDLKNLEGQWQIQEIITNNGQTPDQVLITYTVEVEPDESIPEGVFYSFYKDGIKNVLEAIKQEIERRDNFGSSGLSMINY